MSSLTALGRLSGPDRRPISQDNGMELEGSPAMGAEGGLPGLEILHFGLRQIEAIAELDESAHGIETHLAVGVHEAEVADFHEACGEHVLQEAPDELHDVECHGAQPGGPWLLIAKGDGSILHSHDAAVGDGHLEDIGSEVFQARGAFAHGLAVHVPVCVPDLMGDLTFEAGSLHFVPELGLEDHR